LSELRSAAWFSGDDEVALSHRVALSSSGIEVTRSADKPVIGIANTASDLNPCNLPLRELVPAVKEGIAQAGGIAVEFPAMSLGEDLMKPSAMLYRNLLAIEIEETIRANPLDGVVLLANCDKTVPGSIMGATSADVPTVVVTGGARPAATFRGKRIGSGTDLWRLWDERRTGKLDDEAWSELEACLACGLGACNTMGTASTMAILAEVLGLMVSGSSTIPSGDPAALDAATRAGSVAVEAVRAGRTAMKILSPAAFSNAIRMLHAIGGSTNAVIHLAAMAGRTGVPFPLEDVGRLGRDVPVLADIEPSGDGLIQDFHAGGGVPALMGELGSLLEAGAQAVTGQTLGEIQISAPAPTGAIRPIDDPIRTGGAISVVSGSLAPDGAIVKTSAASPSLLRHEGRAVVFRGYDDMRARIDDPDLEVEPDSVLVLAGCGPAGVPGMPEWAMIPIPAKLSEKGLEDMVRVSDARMSGTSFGTVFLHVAPEASVGGPLALVRDGDLISVDVESGRLDLKIEPDELARRQTGWEPPPTDHLRGWPKLYREHVLQAPEGCDLDFLTAPTAAHRRFVEPVVGRS
jgi:dihydroxy-acid dehydratase